MQQSRWTVQQLYLIVFSIPSHLSQAADTLAQGVFAPICRREVSTATR